MHSNMPERNVCVVQIMVAFHILKQFKFWAIFLPCSIRVKDDANEQKRKKVPFYDAIARANLGTHRKKEARKAVAISSKTVCSAIKYKAVIAHSHSHVNHAHL